MRNSIYKRGTLLLFLVFFMLSGYTQISYQFHRSRNETAWFIAANAGVTSFFGDLARYNSDPIYKIREESKFAFGLSAGKSFNHIYSAQVYFTKGGLKAYNNPQFISYEASLTNYGLQFLINFNTLIGRSNYVPDFYIYGIAGAGAASVKPILYHISSDSLVDQTPIDSLNYASQISTIEINGGLGFNYQILENFDAYIEIVYHYTMSDELDLVVGEKKDAFFHTLFGMKYRFGFDGSKGKSVFARKRR